MPRRQRHHGFLLATAGLGFILLLTLTPQPGAAGRAASTPLACVFCGDAGGVDFFLNLLLFMPLGAGLTLASFSWRRVVVLAALTTLGVELLQMKVVAGRDASLGDIIANTIGGALGVLVVARWRQLACPEPRDARRLGLSYALILAWVWAGTAWAFGPTMPEGGVWFGQWAPDFSNFGRFLGTPLSVTAGVEPLPPGPTIDRQRLEDDVTAHPSLGFRAVLGRAPSRLAPVAMITDTRHGEVILIGQERQDLAFRVRLRASILKLWTPTVNLRNGMSGQPGDTVEAEGALRGGAFELRSRIHGEERVRRLPLSASWGWSLVTPWESVLGEEVGALTALWIAGLLCVLAYWSVLAGRASLVIPLVTVMVLLGVIPRAAGFQPAQSSEWVAALAGILVGLLASRPALRARARCIALEDHKEPSMRTPVTL